MHAAVPGCREESPAPAAAHSPLVLLAGPPRPLPGCHGTAFALAKVGAQPAFTGGTDVMVAVEKHR